jgi:hypothetical protein
MNNPNEPRPDIGLIAYVLRMEEENRLYREACGGDCLEAQLRDAERRARVAEKTLAWIVLVVRGYVPRIMIWLQNESRWSNNNIIPYTLRDAANIYYGLAESDEIDAEEAGGEEDHG